METNEGFRDWFKKFGDMAMNWSPVNAQTIGTYPSKYVDASGREIPEAPDSALRNQPQPMRRAAWAMPGSSPAVQPKQKTVGFKIADMQNLKSAITDYLGLISRFMTVVHRQVPYPNFIRMAINSFEKHVGPAYQDLYKKIQWIDDMNALARSQYEWAVDEEEVLLEAVRINYKRFEEMVKSLQNLAMLFKKWVYTIVQRLPDSQGQRIKAIYDQNVLRQQGFVGKQVQWLQQKLAQLMQANNIPYQQV